MHTEAIRIYMTERIYTYKITPWDTNPNIYWLEKYYNGEFIECTRIYNIEKLFNRLEELEPFENWD